MIYFLPNMFFLKQCYYHCFWKHISLYTHIQLEISICPICFCEDTVKQDNVTHYSCKEFCLTRIDIVTPSTYACRLLLWSIILCSFDFFFFKGISMSHFCRLSFEFCHMVLFSMGLLFFHIGYFCTHSIRSLIK